MKGFMPKVRADLDCGQSWRRRIVRHRCRSHGPVPVFIDNSKMMAGGSLTVADVWS